MRHSLIVSSTLTAVGFALAACNPFNREPVTEVTRDFNLNARWRASLVTPAALGGAVQINGQATMQPGKSAGQTSVSLSIANATPGGTHPWQVHRGQCNADEGVFGESAAYSSVKVGDDGKGSSNATIAVTTPTSGNYFVTVQASAANPETVVACGNLAPPAM